MSISWCHLYLFFVFHLQYGHSFSGSIWILCHICLCGNGYFYINWRTFLVSVYSNSKCIVQKYRICISTLYLALQILLCFCKDTHPNWELRELTPTICSLLSLILLKFCLSLPEWQQKQFVCSSGVSNYITRHQKRSSPLTNVSYRLGGDCPQQHIGGQTWEPGWHRNSVTYPDFWRITQLLRKDLRKAKKPSRGGKSWLQMGEG